jgi:tetratricopeptide (TPR) repeat protein
VSSPQTATSARPGRNDPCPCGSGRKFKQCCGAGRTAAAPVAPPRNGRPDRLDLGLLSEAGKLREAAEGLRQSMHGAPAPFRRAENGARVAAPRQTGAAERFRRQGVGLFEAGKLAAAITALRQATRLDPGDAGSHRALGLALLRSNRLVEAAASFELAIVLEEEVAVAHYHLAVALDRQGLTDNAIAAYRRAVEQAPELAEGHRRLGELLEAEGDAEEAALSYRRAAACAPDTTAGRVTLARALILEGDLPEAEALLRQAITLDPNSDPLHKVLGDVLATEGHFDEAIAAYDRAIGLNPSQAPAHLNAVYVRKCTEADRPRLARMLSSLRDGSLRAEFRVHLHFAIGKLLDDLGEYQQAMQHFDMANRLRGREATFDRAAFSRHCDRLAERFTSAFFAANRAFGLDDETPLLILGMPRSGTTLVEQIISSHPAIAAGGELPFWPRRPSAPGIAEATDLTPEAARDLSREYLAVLRRIGPQAARVTDKAPFNFHRLGLIHLLLPQARIVHCRRHPVDTCLSMYFMHFAERIEFVSDQGNLAFAYREYARLMEHWRAVLPRDRFIEVDYESLVADREAVTRRLVAFTGLDWHDACLEPNRNERAVTTASVWQARQPVYTTSVARWRRYEPWLGELRQLLPASEIHTLESNA